ncbi:hypothetical protein N9B18_01085 [Akkermansiaceae bacterium]|nr:hypothetical protein [Akkermansiaceae bacterium]
MELYLDRRGPERTGEDRLGLVELYGGWTWNVSTIAARILLLVAGPWSRICTGAGGEKEEVI